MALDFEVLKDTREMDALVYLARQSHEESRFSYITFAPDKVEKIAARAIRDPKRQAVMLSKLNDKPVGCLYCSIGEYHIGTGTLITTIQNINVLKEQRSGLQGGRIALGLFRGVETWSKARSSKEVLFHVTSDVNLANTHKFIKRIGYRFIGGSYAKSV